MTTITQYRQAVQDYLRDGYGASDFTLDTRGAHNKLKFELNGVRMTLLLNDRNGSGSSNAPDLKFQDIRRKLGEPTYPNASSRKGSRTLEQMTQGIAAPARNGHAQREEPEDEHRPVPTVYLAAVALYAAGKSLRFRFPPELIEAFKPDSSAPEGTEISFTAPDLWSIRHGTGPKFKLDGKHYALICGGSRTWEKLGVFASTPVEARLVNGRIEVRLTEGPVKATPKPDGIAAGSAAAASLPEPSPPPSPLRVPLREPDATHTGHVTESDMREALRSIHHVEALTLYRLRKVKIGETEQWRFMAPSISLEDES